MVQVRKQWAEFRVESIPHDLHDKVRNVFIFKGVHMAFADDVWYVFKQPDKVTAYSTAEVYLDTAKIIQRIFRATGSFPSGMITKMTFETSVTGLRDGVEATQLYFLDILHARICNNPPVGTVTNVFSPGYYPDVIFNHVLKDGFRVTFHVRPSGSCLLVCSASRCAKPLSGKTFEERARRAMEYYGHIISWT